jgi:hypothetical protein
MENLDQKRAELLTVLNLIGKGKMSELTGIMKGVKEQKQAKARDWDLMAFPDVRPLCTNPTEKRKKCNAYDDGRCDDDLGPCKGAGAIDPDEEFIPAGRKSMAEELEDELKELGDFTDEEMGREAPTLMSLITKNAQWRV